METIKTAVVVVLLLAVLYGVYIVLNKPELTPPPEIGWDGQPDGPPKVEIGTAGVGSIPADMVGVLPADSHSASHDHSAYAAATAQRAGSDSMGYPKESAMEQPPTFEVPTPYQASPLATDANRYSQPLADLDEAVNETTPANQYQQPGAQTTHLSDSASADSNNLQSPAVQLQTVRAFDSAWSSAMAQLERQQWAEALFTLSVFYHDPEVTGEERQRLIDLLDPLAGKVIYSDEHTLEPAHRVAEGETLAGIAQQYQIPWTLLQSINGITNPDNLPPGAELKVMRGPFRAEIDLNKSELVLFAGKYYAGRFALSVGNDPAPNPGSYQVVDKKPGHQYVSTSGVQFPARSAENPYGAWWIDLGDNVTLHGSPEVMPSHGGLGCLSLSDKDAADVAAILSVGSKVIVR